MLKLSRTTGQAVHIGGDLICTLETLWSGSAKLRFDAPRTDRRAVSIIPLNGFVQLGVVTVHLLDINRGQARLGFEAPADVHILREELVPGNRPRGRGRAVA
ncbi:carbon storage regulator [Thioalbus denitrificans]|uniref:Carbon storage regulator CsrA n=1 Tax=Thioalbus denitrificans TaxID=547122 RepID=A0A369CHE4_9GAMM|nr:carbon storage regulator [Thioalbus denitrificans]RCX32106.1 carbon storage regulator CsrA [Thioalbus denitrificans]